MSATGEEVAGAVSQQASNREKPVGHRLLRGLRDVVLLFILPVAGLGVVLWGVEEVLLAFGVHGHIVKYLRLLVLPVYGFMVWRLMKGRGR